MNGQHFSFLHLLATLGGIVLTAVSPAVQTAISHHPTLSMILLGLYAALGVVLPPPFSK